MVLGFGPRALVLSGRPPRAGRAERAVVDGVGVRASRPCTFRPSPTRRPRRKGCRRWRWCWGSGLAPLYFPAVPHAPAAPEGLSSVAMVLGFGPRALVLSGRPPRAGRAGRAVVGGDGVGVR